MRVLRSVSVVMTVLCVAGPPRLRALPSSARRRDTFVLDFQVGGVVGGVIREGPVF